MLSTYPLFFIIKCHFSSYFASHGINAKWNVSGNWIIYDCILSFISIYSMHTANLLVSFTFMYSEHVWKICEFWVLVINICYFDINCCSTGQATSIFCFYYLPNKDHRHFGRVHISNCRHPSCSTTNFLVSLDCTSCTMLHWQRLHTFLVFWWFYYWSGYLKFTFRCVINKTIVYLTKQLMFNETPSWPHVNFKSVFMSQNI